MGKALIIVESPAKARTLEKFLGRRYTLRASRGHVRDLPKSQFGVDIEAGFVPKYITIRGKGEVVKELREAAKKADTVLLATDPDREGEAISWHLATVLSLDDSQPCRVVFHEITRDAVTRALKEPRPLDHRLVDAQQARRVLDRLVGYKLSPLLWRKIRPGLSAGRVQSVAVRLVVDREREIEAFQPREYWTVSVRLRTLDGRGPFVARYVGEGGERAELGSQAEAEAVVRALEEGPPPRVVSVQVRPRRRQPAPPFTTSTLQQEASRRLGFSVRKTMALAQMLYEGLEVPGEGRVGLITYMRTDSVRVAEVAKSEAAAFIRARYGEAYAHPAAPRKGPARPGVQDAHEAIRPTSVERTPGMLQEALSPDLYRLYRLIWERFVASQMSPAQLEVTTVDVAVGSYRLRASGSRVVFPGYRIVYEESRDEEGGADGEEALPALQEGEELAREAVEAQQHFTEPPPRYTEATLVRTLEEKGIGRPSTYAPIIDTIQERGYVEKRQRHLYPTELGRTVVDLLIEHFPLIVDPAFTARMEADLDRVEAGEVPWQQVVASFYYPFAEDLAHAEQAIGDLSPREEVTDIPCEQCGSPLVVRHGRFGKFLACQNYPQCRYTRPYLEPTGVHCPRCGGEVVERRSRRGRRFYGCSNYPACDFVSWYRPIPRTCPLCGQFLVERRVRGAGTVYRCVNDRCSYEEPAGEEEHAGA